MHTPAHECAQIGERVHVLNQQVDIWPSTKPMLKIIKTCEAAFSIASQAFDKKNNDPSFVSKFKSLCGDYNKYHMFHFLHLAM